MSSNDSGLMGAVQGLGKAYGIIVLLPMLLLGIFYFSPAINIMFFVLHATETTEQSRIVEKGYEYFSHKSTVTDYNNKMNRLQERYDEISSAASADYKAFAFEDWFMSFINKIDNGTALSMVLIMVLYILVGGTGLFLAYTAVWLVVQFFKFVKSNILLNLAWIATCIVNLISVLNTMPSGSGVTFMASHIDFLKVLGVIFDLLFVAFVIFVAVAENRTYIVKTLNRRQMKRDSSGRFVKSRQI